MNHLTKLTWRNLMIAVMLLALPACSTAPGSTMPPSNPPGQPTARPTERPIPQPTARPTTAPTQGPRLATSTTAPNGSLPTPELPGTSAQRYSLSSANDASSADVLMEAVFQSGGGRGFPCRSTSPEFVAIDNPIELGWDFFVVACGWEDSESVQVTLRFPDGNIVSWVDEAEFVDGADGNAVIVSFPVGFNYPTGNYQVVLSGESSEITTSVYVNRPSGPRFYSKWDGENIFYNFRAKEQVNLYCYETDENSHGSLLAWYQLQVDAQGQLLVQISDLPQNHACIAVGSLSGEVHPRYSFGVPLWPDVTISGGSSGGSGSGGGSSSTPVCSGAPSSQLSSGIHARVAFSNGLPMNIRNQPSRSGEVILQIKEGSELDILDGPVCADGYLWWKVETEDGTIGWAAEGDKKDYFIEPWE